MILGLTMGFLMARCAEGDQILGCIIAQSGSRLNVMNLKILHLPTILTTPSISLLDFPAELAISLGVKPQSWSFCADSLQNVTWTSSRSCFLSGFGRPMTNQVRQGNRASRLP